ncbi:prepilin-type N-terminal cleavage/methylation domain-containing protein [Marinobacter sp. JSM 1782161]|uniref:prepilin-type N-terminal cleavage/methylation domain-containing protein n=1 Tax=Marinobacter sp. JSM 1782161 TaxID=2685906 RepID=UPI001402CAA3|nr:prepilin-type N-terminal cleavage/methylation domain-containing protein [Marinobacter sp. JSM 1782161]
MNHSRSHRAASQGGFSLIELMISLVIGLIIIGTVTGAFLMNSQVYESNRAMGRIQENARFAFELMSRDIRRAGEIPCGTDIDIANVLNNSADNTESGTSNDWWARFGDGLEGFDGEDDFDGAGFGDSEAQRLSGSDAIWITATGSHPLSVVSHDTDAATLTLNSSDHPFEQGDILLVCDFDQASIFQMSGPASTGTTVQHLASSGLTPGNCTQGLGVSVACGGSGTTKSYDENSLLARFDSTAWYLGCNGRDDDCSTPEGRSLYRVALENGSEVTREVVDSVSALGIQYLEDGDTDYEDAAEVGDWGDVVAVKLGLTLARSDAGVGTNGADDITRNYTHVVTLRNRLP